jgi:hypothetical protein
MKHEFSSPHGIQLSPWPKNLPESLIFLCQKQTCICLLNASAAFLPGVVI